MSGGPAAVGSTGSSGRRPWVGRGRRPNGDGTITRRRDGLWQGAVFVTTSHGARRREYVYGRDRDLVRDRVAALVAREAAGRAVPHERWTLAAYLQHWLAEVVRPTRAPRTYQGYEAVVRRHLPPAIGHRPLARLSTRDVHLVLAQVRASGASPRQVQWVHAVLRTALTSATREELTTRNVALLVHTPTVVSRIGRALSVPETRRILQAAAGDRLEAVFVLAVHLGMRQAELLGLRWVDVDLAAGRLQVAHSLQRVDGRLALVAPKTPASHRTLPLPAPVITALVEHRARQAGERDLAGAAWVDSGMVFTTAIGGPLSPDAVRRSWTRIRPAVTGRVRFDDLRHTCLTLLLNERTPPHVVQQIAGHAALYATMTIYAHASTEQRRAALDQLGDQLTTAARDQRDDPVGTRGRASATSG
ncbi:MAG: site-specific integrase [Kineosporiaceae bacterium]|nr:site-specific integrase [Kineosporiaceae bacterium]